MVNSNTRVFFINSWSYHNCLICPFLICNYVPQYKCRNACPAVRGYASFWYVLSNHEVMHRNCEKTGTFACWKGSKIWNPKPTRQSLHFPYPLWRAKNGTQSSKINGKDNDLEYNLLITCRYMNIVQNQNSPIPTILDGYIFMQHSLNLYKWDRFSRICYVFVLLVAK